MRIFCSRPLSSSRHLPSLRLHLRSRRGSSFPETAHLQAVFGEPTPGLEPGTPSLRGLGKAGSGVVRPLDLVTRKGTVGHRWAGKPAHKPARLSTLSHRGRSLPRSSATTAIASSASAVEHGSTARTPGSSAEGQRAALECASGTCYLEEERPVVGCSYGARLHGA
jgi:hypothetical protein